MDALVQVLSTRGFNARKPKGSFFLYVKAPRAVTKKNGSRAEFKNAEEVCESGYKLNFYLLSALLSAPHSANLSDEMQNWL